MNVAQYDQAETTLAEMTSSPEAAGAAMGVIVLDVGTTGTSVVVAEAPPPSPSLPPLLVTDDRVQSTTDVGGMVGGIIGGAVIIIIGLAITYYLYLKQKGEKKDAAVWLVAEKARMADNPEAPVLSGSSVCAMDHVHGFIRVCSVERTKILS